MVNGDYEVMWSLPNLKR